MVLFHVSSEVAPMSYSLFTMLTLKLTIVALFRNLNWTWFIFKLSGAEVVFLNVSSEVVPVGDCLLTKLTVIEVIIPLFRNLNVFRWFLQPFLLPHMFSNVLVEILHILKLAIAL